VGFDENSLVPKALDLEGMERIKQGFVEATKRAMRAGFDWVEVHGGHGFLIHEYLSPISNKRTDCYGGSLENRMRFPLEILAAVRAAIPADRPLGLRVSGSEWVTDQPSHDINEVCAFVQAAKGLGVDYVCVSSIGNGRGAIPFGPLFQVPLAAAIREKTGISTRAVGMIATPFEAEGVLREGKADMIALGRPFLYNPRWVWHAARAMGVPYEFSTEFVSLKDAWWPVIDKATAWKSPK
jgi:NADPH2 dehydrogenase